MGETWREASPWEAEELVSEGLDAPALYRGLSTEYADVGRLMEFLGGRLFSGLMRVILPEREAHVLMFRGKPKAARYAVEGRHLEAAEAIRQLLLDSRRMEGEIWVHRLPEELFPDSWEERAPISWEEAQPSPILEEELEPAVPVGRGPEPATTAVKPEPSPVLEAPPPSGQEVDLATWVKLLEAVVARFRRYWGPTATARLEAEVSGVLQARGLRFRRGKLEGRPESPEVLRYAFARAVEVISGMAGRTFLEQTLVAAVREAGLRDEKTLRAVLGLD